MLKILFHFHFSPNKIPFRIVFRNKQKSIFLGGLGFLAFVGSLDCVYMPFMVVRQTKSGLDLFVRAIGGK